MKRIPAIFSFITFSIVCWLIRFAEIVSNNCLCESWDSSCDDSLVTSQATQQLLLGEAVAARLAQLRSKNSLTLKSRCGMVLSDAFKASSPCSLSPGTTEILRHWRVRSTRLHQQRDSSQLRELIIDELSQFELNLSGKKVGDSLV